MNRIIQQHWDKKSLKQKSLIGALFFFLLISFIAASGIYLQGTSSAAASTKPPQPVESERVMPESFADLAEALSPTVVNIKATKIEPVRGFQRPQIPGGPFEDFFEHFFRGMPQTPGQRQRYGAGSGVIINSAGYILTNNHVVEGAKELTVTLNDRKELKAEIVGRDPKTDLAVLKIKTDVKLPSATMGDSEQLRVGEWVLAIGNPFGLNNTVTSGIVSAKGRIIGAGPYDDFIQTDASINPGNSGGPLFNMKGELVGINTAIIPQGQGIGFAIPINTAKPLIPQLVEKGEVSRGYLGVMIQTITPDLAKALKVKDPKGALVADVVPGGPADKAGIKRGDIIVAYDDHPVKDSHDLPQRVAATPEGKKAVVTLIRDGDKHELTVKIGKLASAVAGVETSRRLAEQKWGLTLKDRDPEAVDNKAGKVDRGVVVAGVKPGSPADISGIRRGDIILEVNRVPVDSINEAKNQIAKAEDGDSSLLLLVKRDRGSFFVGLTG